MEEVQQQQAQQNGYAKNNSSNGSSSPTPPQTDKMEQDGIGGGEDQGQPTEKQQTHVPTPTGNMVSVAMPLLQQTGKVSIISIFCKVERILP
jgi:hypothetical protein